MQVKCGDMVKLRDGRIVSVEDAADQDPDAYRTYRESADGSLELVSELPVETIFVGRQVLSNKVGPLAVRTLGATVVSDMSEVISILN